MSSTGTVVATVSALTVERGDAKPTSLGVLPNPGSYQLPDEGCRQWLVWLKADRPFTGVVVLELVRVGGHGGRAHQIEGAVGRSRAKRDKHSIETECGQLIADAFFSIWRRGANRLSKFLERGSLVIAQGGEVPIDGLDLGFEFGCHYGPSRLVSASGPDANRVTVRIDDDARRSAHPIWPFGPRDIRSIAHTTPEVPRRDEFFVR